MIERRTFLGWLAATVATACTRNPGSDPVPSHPPATPSPTTAIPSTEPPPSEPVEQEDVLVDSIDAPAQDVAAPAFPLAVASGDPASDGFVLWTSIASAQDSVEFVWEVAADDQFTHLVATGLAKTDDGRRGTTQVVVEGLSSARIYWYRFRADTQISAVGRTRTLPDPDSDPGVMRIGVSSCQLRSTGAWAAHRDLAEADLDLFVWLGDYIYERGADGETATDLAGYRDRYREYRSDPALQAAHQAHPWLIGWDDHEVVNDYDAAVDASRRSAAYQAWREFQPTRVGEPTETGLDIFRSLRFGRLAEIDLVDVRQYADSQTLLGDRQREWLRSQVGADDRAAWTVLASPVVFGGLNGPSDDGSPTLPYSWDGYPDERAEVARLLGEGDSIVVSGDLHTSLALDVRANPGILDEPVLAAEFMAPSISSAFPADLAPLAPFLGIVNPHLRHIDVTNGWLLLEITPEFITATYRYVVDVSDPASAVEEGASWRVARGVPTMEPAS